MLPIWQQIAAGAVNRWLGTVLAPALFYWFGGITVLVAHYGWPFWEGWFNALSPNSQKVFLTGLLLLVLASAAFVQEIEFPLLRFLEGYWPRVLAPVRRLLTQRWARRLTDMEARFQTLARQPESLKGQALAEYLALDQELRNLPDNPERLMPTAVGNVLRAAEDRPAIRYGLDSIICWPRLWLLLPEGVQGDLSDAQGALYGAVRGWAWAFLFLVWTYYTYWALPVALVATLLTYRAILRAAATYGDLIEAAYDLYRPALYEALRWPLPATPAEEQLCGAMVTAYLWRGSDQPTPTFTVGDRRG